MKKQIQNTKKTCFFFCGTPFDTSVDKNKKGAALSYRYPSNCWYNYSYS